MKLEQYHYKIWLPFSTKVDEIIKPYKILRVLKKLFDVHFTILGLLGVFATPKDDVDCYGYMCKRTKPHKYQGLSWKKRRKLIKELFYQAWSA